MATKKNQIVPPPTLGIRNSFHSLIAILVTILVIAVVYLSQNGGQLLEKCSKSKASSIESDSSCNLFSGKWVFDNESYPLYNEKQCTFMSDQLACEKFGRQDLSFRNWRWQPHHCDLPRFNATALLERLRNKRLVFVGDSLNRGMWVSMVCLLDSAILPSFKTMHANGSLNIFKATEYNASIEFYWAPLLVESNSDDPVSHRVPDRIVRIQAIEKHARFWTDADILVFNSYLWWRRPKMKVLWGSFESSDGIYKEVKMLRVYEMALKTWSDWLEVHVNPNKTQLFFVSMSPIHERAQEWGGAKGKNCYGETEQIFKEGYRGRGTDPKMMRVVENVLDNLKTRGLNVQMLNITQLSDYRKEAHPSIYRKQWEPLTEKQISDPSSYADCDHWCLPGVPDRWSKKKTQFPLLALLFLVFIVLSILHYERSILQIQEDQDHVHNDHHHQQSPFIFVKPNLSRLQSRAPEVLDRFSRCNSTREYSRRKIEWTADRKTKSGRRRKSSETCDVFSGKWVFDNTSYPLYKESECPYMSDQLACHKHGRDDLSYQYWRWQPHGCNLKRWNVTEIWEKLRGKRLMFVGDSLNRGQWISMVCLLQSVIPADKKSMSPNAPLTIFRAEEYNATIEFLWAPLLVESNSDDPVNHRLDDRIIRPDTVLKHSSQWEHADILIFNTYLWWRQGPVKLLWSTEESGICEKLDGLGAMELAMEAWADWITTKVDPHRKKKFCRMIGGDHPSNKFSADVTIRPIPLAIIPMRNREWNPGSEGNCYSEKTPINLEGYWGSGSDLPTMRMVDKVLNKLGSKVSVLNITQLSEYRKDGHPSVYRKFWEPLKPEQLSNPASYSDCIHWCLPGVPDVWNELLFQFL
ncbi:Trichome birefringence-like family [Trema orientale]|uniref:Trichome birefringence-like family n=1 Tax=Trema orientale TaxID=63057 RepID=A0A2P5F966_TREOI|nr:Trichome birefringence-like family [Trema orientale]